MSGKSWAWAALNCFPIWLAATILAFLLFGLTVVLGLTDLALGQRSPIDVAVVVPPIVKMNETSAY